MRCQVVYVDGDVQTPAEQLKDFIAGNYCGAEYEDLVRRYYDGLIGFDLDWRFPAYVRDRMAEVGIDIEIVKVQIFAEGDLRRALIEVLKE